MKKFVKYGDLICIYNFREISTSNDDLNNEKMKK